MEGLVVLSRDVATVVERQAVLRTVASTVLGVLVKPVHATACGTVCNPIHPCPGSQCTCGPSGNKFDCIDCLGGHYCDCFPNCLRQCFGC